MIMYKCQENHVVVAVVVKYTIVNVEEKDQRGE
jgi:hypothetical protein